MTGPLGKGTAASLLANLIEARGGGSELMDIYQSFCLAVVFLTYGPGPPGNHDATSRTCARKLTDARVSRSRLQGS
jgi:hypothetical protein